MNVVIEALIILGGLSLVWVGFAFFLRKLKKGKDKDRLTKFAYFYGTFSGFIMALLTIVIVLFVAILLFLGD